jgi:DNA-binding PadR family transcriptional regulator
MKPREKTTNIHRVLEALNQKEQSSQELADSLKIPVGTSRSTLSLLTRLGLTEFDLIKKRGKPFRITEKGKERLLELREEQNEMS